MPSISSLGIGSGLDIGGLVSQIIAAERAPTQTRLDRREAEALGKITALGSVKGALSTFQSALEPLKDLATFQGRTASSADAEVFTATADASAIAGRYAVEVTSLASGHKLRSDAYASSDTEVGTGTLTVSTGAEIFTVDISSPTNTLADIASSINDAVGNTEVLATVVNSVDGAHLVLTTASTGAAKAITVTSTGGDGGLDDLAYDPANKITNLIEVTAAADGSLLIDGLEVTATSNVVSDAIQGVTIDLLSADPGTTNDLTIGYDNAGARELVNGFVENYNSLLQSFADQSGFDVETFQAGPLFGESGMRALSSDLRSAVGGFIDSDSETYRALADIGITTDLDGSLIIDEATLSGALSANFDEVGRLFAGIEGFAANLDSLVSDFLGPTGRLETRTDVLGLLIDDLGDQRDALDRRMISVEERLVAQFSALDSLVSQLDSTSNFLGQQLGNLPGFTNPNQ